MGERGKERRAWEDNLPSCSIRCPPSSAQHSPGCSRPGAQGLRRPHDAYCRRGGNDVGGVNVQQQPAGGRGASKTGREMTLILSCVSEFPTCTEFVPLAVVKFELGTKFTVQLQSRPCTAVVPCGTRWYRVDFKVKNSKLASTSTQAGSSTVVLH